ncbi:hypothetical protein F5Y15DRAFT_125313 [Xylariaceae sp. FL0016]|nr:hypothetical protein F5Y15DRAFT_125313 [Xylariaceae sp. FL0016]
MASLNSTVALYARFADTGRFVAHPRPEPTHRSPIHQKGGSTSSAAPTNLNTRPRKLLRLAIRTGYKPPIRPFHCATTGSHNQIRSSMLRISTSIRFSVLIILTLISAGTPTLGIVPRSPGDYSWTITWMAPRSCGKFPCTYSYNVSAPSYDSAEVTYRPFLPIAQGPSTRA